MNVGLFHCKFRGLDGRQNLADTGFKLLPTVIFQRRFIEERVGSLRVELRLIRGIQRGPTVPYFLKVGGIRYRRLRSRSLSSRQEGCDKD